jgi:ectoine hydroxylase-related dioxygenase (phytanoyl-CoA dioxygenase family)
MTYLSQDFIDSTPILGDAQALRARADEEGCLFFKHLLPREAVTKLRADMLDVVEQYGWRTPGRDVADSTIDTDALNRVSVETLRTDIGVSIEAYHSVQKLASLHRLPHHPALVALYETLFDGEVLVHPRHIARMITPHHAMVPTPPHQDFPLIQGTAQTWTAWIPLGDCPREMGGLTILRASHRKGYLPIEPARGAGLIAAQLCPGEEQWLTTDYSAGDVLTFPAYTVHKGLPARTKDQIRLSLDVRYQPADQQIEEKSLLPHCELTWEQIYADWPTTYEDLKYFWRREALTMSQWNEALLQPSRRIC